MEKFGYQKGWKAHEFMDCGYPVFPLLLLLAFWVLLVLPSRGEASGANFKWWVPPFAVAMAVWLVLEIKKFRKALAFSVELSEEAIKVCGEEAKWTDVTRVESKIARGNNFAVILHTRNGGRLGIPGATASLPYIRGFIDGHAKSAERA